jgi:hypothetical protein
MSFGKRALSLQQLRALERDLERKEIHGIEKNLLQAGADGEYSGSIQLVSDVEESVRGKRAVPPAYCKACRRIRSGDRLLAQTGICSDCSSQAK